MLTRKEIEVIKLRRANLTQVDVARKLKISQAAVSNFEKKAVAKVKQAHQILQIAKELKIKTENE